MLTRIVGLCLLMVGTAGAQCFPEASCRVTHSPAVQTIATGDTIKADACGSTKPVSAAGAVTTSTTNTFEVPNGGNSGCIMAVCNVSANTITLDSNTFVGSGAANVSLTQDDCVMVGRVDDPSGPLWLQLSAVLSNN